MGKINHNYRKILNRKENIEITERGKTISCVWVCIKREMEKNSIPNGKMPKMALGIHPDNYHYVPEVGRMSEYSIMLYLMGSTAGWCVTRYTGPSQHISCQIFKMLWFTMTIVLSTVYLLSLFRRSSFRSFVLLTRSQFCTDSAIFGLPKNLTSNYYSTINM